MNREDEFEQNIEAIKSRMKIVENYPWPQYPLYIVGKENKLMNDYLRWAHQCRTDIPFLVTTSKQLRTENQRLKKGLKSILTELNNGYPGLVKKIVEKALAGGSDE